MADLILAVNIGLDPNLFSVGGLDITWHGLFSALGVVAGVFVSAAYARRAGYSNDTIYNVALFLVVGGIIGARALHVIEDWERFSDNLGSIFAINTGGISIYGALIGGTVGAVLYGFIANVPDKWKAADVAALGAIMGMAVGRIGDVINGEHWAEATSLPWGVRYTDVDSPGQLGPLGPDAVSHPAVAYELLGDLAIFALLLFVLRRVRRPGFVFLVWVVSYAALRLGISFLRFDDIVFAGLRTAQVVAVVALILSVPLLIHLLRRGESAGLARAERRRRGRAK